MKIAPTIKSFAFTLLKRKLAQHNYALVHDTDLDMSGTDKYLDSEEFRYILMLDRAYQKIATVPGHIVEVGVARGRNAILFGRFIQAYGDHAFRHYFGFDTFDGYVPEALSHSPHLSSSQWKATSASWVKSRLRRLELNDICHIHEGDIGQTGSVFLQNSSGPKHAPGHFKTALLYVDCNAFTSATDAMEIFYPTMTPGSIICIDEKKQGGETKALQEFCAAKGLKMIKDKSPFSMPAYTVIPS